jgi:VIT1/CCC1 family predicted Fe2+/Mn2+ transporter
MDETLRTGSEHAHTRAAIRERLRGEPRGSYLADYVYGAIDGVVTTFAVVAGVAGAELSGGIVVILGLANLLADGASMAAANFVGTRTEAARRRQIRDMEERHVAAYPDGEREEIREIYRQKGFTGPQLEGIVDVITADRRRWIDTMLVEEHGFSLAGRSAWHAATATFVAFLVAGSLPLLVYIGAGLFGLPLRQPFWWSVGLTAFAFLTIGAVKGRVTGQRPVIAALETVGVGGGAAALAYLVGAALRGVVEL